MGQREKPRYRTKESCQENVLRFTHALINVRECKSGESQKNSQNALKWESF